MSIIDKINDITEGTMLSDRIKFDKFIKKLKGMTARNDHTGAYILISTEILKNKKLIKIFNALEEIINLEGGMSGNLSKYQYEKYQEMMNQVKAKLDDIDYQAIYQST